MSRQSISSLQNDLALQSTTHHAQLLSLQCRYSTELDTTRSELRVAEGTILKLQKELDSSKSSYTYQSSQASQYLAELESLHQVLDAIPMAPLRHGEEDRYGTKASRSVLTRLAGYFASRMAAGV